METSHTKANQNYYSPHHPHSSFTLPKIPSTNPGPGFWPSLHQPYKTSQPQKLQRNIIKVGISKPTHQSTLPSSFQTYLIRIIAFFIFKEPRYSDSAPIYPDLAPSSNFSIPLPLSFSPFVRPIHSILVSYHTSPHNCHSQEKQRKKENSPSKPSTPPPSHPSSSS